MLAGTLGVATAFCKEGLHLLARIVGFVAKVLRGVDGRVDVRVLGVVDDVSRASVEQLLHHLNDLIDRLHRAHVVLRREDGEQLHVGAEQVDLGGTELAPVHPIALSAFEQRVINIRDVLGVVDLIPVIQQLAIDQVKGQIRRGVAQVGGVIGRDAADVHGGGIARDLHRLDRGVSRVIQTEGLRSAGDGIDVRCGP